jgi:hypothetical protein
VRLVAPDDRPIMAFMGLFMAKMAPAMGEMAVQFAPDEAAKAEARGKLDALKGALDKVMSTHGVDLTKADDATMQGMMGQGEPDAEKVRAFFQENFASLDSGAFLTDVFATIAEHGSSRQAMSLSKGFQGELKDLRIDGDRATATADDDDIVFVREAGRWFISLSEMMKKKAEK